MTQENAPRWWHRPERLVFLGFLAIAGFFLITEHTAHLLGILPYLLLAACPLMHIFMHRGHQHDKHKHDEHRDHTPQR